MTVYTTAGSTIAISAAAPATFDSAGYGALTWAVIGEITDMGEFGREYALVTHNPVDSRGTVKKKGSYNEGTMTLQLGLDAEDDGQVIAQQAVGDDDEVSIRIVRRNGETNYLSALVMNFKNNLGSVDTITNGSIALEITRYGGA